MRRNDLDICADILKVAKNGAKKTQMVYKANLNFNIVKRYIKRLTDSGLLESVNGLFFATDKGSQFLARYREFVEPLSVLRGNEL
jgi:predicted transcriptional regulator